MLERSFRNLAPAKHFPDTFGDQLQRFATSLKRQGYADRTVRQKLRVLTNCGQWMGQLNLAVTKLDDQLLATFLKHRKLPLQNGDPSTLQQFLDHLRRQNVVRTQHLPRDRSPLAQILREYEKHLSLERGLLVNTILQYQSFIRKFLLEHFRGRPFLLTTTKASDISAFVLRHAPSMSVWTTQAMTTAFRSFFRFLSQKGEVRADLAAAAPPGGELAAIHRAQVSGSGRGQTCAQVLRPSYGDRSPQLCHSYSTCSSRSSRWRSGCSPT